MYMYALYIHTCIYVIIHVHLNVRYIMLREGCIKHIYVVCRIILEQCLFFWLCLVACGILVLQTGIEPVSPAVETQSPDPRTTREALEVMFI